MRDVVVSSGNAPAELLVWLANGLANETQTPCKWRCSCRSRKPFRAVRSDEGSNPSAPVNKRSAPKRRSACCAAAVSASASASPHSSARVERNPPTSVLAGEPLANERPPKNTNQRVSDEHRYPDQGEARRRAVATSGTRKRPTPELRNSSPPLEVNASLLSGHARRRSGFSRR